MIAIVDYGLGNIKNVINAFNYLGYETKLTDNTRDLNSAKAIILPGVGAFRDGIKNLQDKDLVEPLRANIKDGKPLLGICLGMQLLYENSFEDGDYEGLSVLSGNVEKLKGDLKIPHMGWNHLDFHRSDPILKYIQPGDFAYFVHSYYCNGPKDDLVASCEYGIQVPSIVNQDNIYGIQFHPEKSSNTGLSILKDFGEMIK